MQDEAKFKAFVAEMNEIVQTIVNKENYLAATKHPGLMAFVIKNAIYCIKPGLYKLGYIPKIYNYDDRAIVHFLRTENVEITHGDGGDVFAKYKDDARCLLLVDPPYLLCDNSNYSKGCKESNIYEYCSDNPIEKMNARIAFIEGQLAFTLHLQGLHQTNLRQKIHDGKEGEGRAYYHL
jgi:hypothetical protein